MSSLLKMMSLPAPYRTDPDWLAAMEAYVEAAKARDKAASAFDKAEGVLQQREAEMRAVYERLTGEAGNGG